MSNKGPVVGAISGSQLRQSMVRTNPLALSEFLKVAVKPKISSHGELPKVWCEDEGGKKACAICLDEVVVGEEARLRGCDHVFHTECVSEWVKRKATCPLCRTDMYSSGVKRARK